MSTARIQYAEIDLEGTKALLLSSRSLKVMLGRLRGWTMTLLINEDRKLKSRRGLSRVLTGILSILWLPALAAFNSNLIVLHCIYVNYCAKVEWKQEVNGGYEFIFTANSEI